MQKQAAEAARHTCWPARMQPLETPPPLRASLAGGKYSGLHFVAAPLRKWSLKDPSVRKKKQKINIFECRGEEVPGRGGAA